MDAASFDGGRRGPGRRAPALDVAGDVAEALPGVGVGLVPRFVGEGDPALLRLDGPVPAHHEMWLLVHGELRRTPRVAAVIDWLDEVVAAVPALSGR